MNPTATSSRKIPLRAALVLPFVLQIFTAVSLTGALSLRNGQKAVNDVANQLRQELIARIEGELKQYVNKPYDVNRLNSAAFAQAHIDMVKGYNAQQFSTQVEISNLSYLSQYTQDLLELVQLYQKYYPHPVSEIQAKSEEVDLDFLTNRMLCRTT